MQPEPDEATQLTEASDAGDPLATARLWSLCHEELKRMSRSLLAGERRTVSLQTTVLVNDAWLRIHGMEAPPEDWSSQSQFFAYVWRVMQHCLVDCARQRNALKRGGDRQRVAFEIVSDGLFDLDPFSPDAAELMTALEELLERSPREHEVIWRRFALGQTIEEVMHSMDCARTTVTDDWRSGRAWLHARLSHPDNGRAGGTLNHA